MKIKTKCEKCGNDLVVEDFELKTVKYKDTDINLKMFFCCVCNEKNYLRTLRDD